MRWTGSHLGATTPHSTKHAPARRRLASELLVVAALAAGRASVSAMVIRSCGVAASEPVRSRVCRPPSLPPQSGDSITNQPLPRAGGFLGSRCERQALPRLRLAAALPACDGAFGRGRDPGFTATGVTVQVFASHRAQWPQGRQCVNRHQRAQRTSSRMQLTRRTLLLQLSTQNTESSRGKPHFGLPHGEARGRSDR